MQIKKDDIIFKKRFYIDENNNLFYEGMIVPIYIDKGIYCGYNEVIKGFTIKKNKNTKDSYSFGVMISEQGKKEIFYMPIKWLDNIVKHRKSTH